MFGGFLAEFQLEAGSAELQVGGVEQPHQLLLAKAIVRTGQRLAPERVGCHVDAVVICSKRIT